MCDFYTDDSQYTSTQISTEFNVAVLKHQKCYAIK